MLAMRSLLRAACGAGSGEHAAPLPVAAHLLLKTWWSACLLASMSSLVGLHQLLDAVSLAEDAGDHSKAVRLIRRWLDGAALEMCGP